MPRQKRYKTKYPGVFYVEGTAVGTSKAERIYYIRYRRDGQTIEERAGRQYQNDMTPAKAALIRAKRIEGDQPSNRKRREEERVKTEAERNRWTIKRLWESYLENKTNFKGRVTDENRFQNYLLPAFGDKEPQKISAFDVDRLRIRLLKKRSPSTVRNVLELLRRIINHGVRKNYCNGLRFPIEMPKVDNKVTEDLTPEQLRALLKAIDEDHDIQVANMMRMALFTGMRRGELFRLQWNHVDFSRGFIRLVDPKGGSEQTIPINDAAREIFKNHPQTSDFVFPGRNGGQRTEARKSLNRIKIRAGLPANFRPLHGLRHTYASMLASSGKVDLYTLQKLLTHKSTEMTQRYAHLRDEALRQASNLASDIVAETVATEDKGKFIDRFKKTKTPA